MGAVWLVLTNSDHQIMEFMRLYIFHRALTFHAYHRLGKKRVKNFYLQIMPIMQKWPSKNMLDDVSCKFKLFGNCWKLLKMAFF